MALTSVLRAEPDLVPEWALVVGDPGRAEMAAGRFWEYVTFVGTHRGAGGGAFAWRWGRRLFDRETDRGRSMAVAKPATANKPSVPWGGAAARDFGLPRRIRRGRVSAGAVDLVT